VNGEFVGVCHEWDCVWRNEEHRTDGLMAISVPRMINGFGGSLLDKSKCTSHDGDLASVVDTGAVFE